MAINDLITRVNGTPTIGLTYNQIFDYIKSLRKPIILHFLGLPIITDEEDVKAVTESIASEASIKGDRKASASDSEGSADDGEISLSEEEGESMEGSDSGEESGDDNDRKPTKHASKAMADGSGSDSD